MSLPSAKLVATTFSEMLKQELSPFAFGEMKRRNAAESDCGICHSHDFCDANMVMDAALRSLGVDMDAEEMSDSVVALWNAAWRTAFYDHLGGTR